MARAVELVARRAGARVRGARYPVLRCSAGRGRSFCLGRAAELAACNTLACTEPDRNRRIRAQLWISVHRGCVKGLLLLLACEDKHRFEA